MFSRAISLFFALLSAVACGEAAQPTTPTPVSSASSKSTTPVTSSTVAPATPVDVVCKALDDARAAQVDKLRTITQSKDPLLHVASASEDVVRAFTHCKKTKSGAWGIGIADLKEELHGVSAQLVVFHADAKGDVKSMVMNGASARTKDRSFASHDQDHVAIGMQEPFDYDGDGEEELIITGWDQTAEGPRDPFGFVVEFKAGTVALYGPSKDILFFRAEDVERDGRPDLVLYGPYRSRGPARCNGASTAFVGPALLAHSLPNGTFSLVDEKATNFAKIACEKPGFAVARDDEKKVDDEQTFVNIACARLWGMSEAQATSSIDSSCHAIPGEAGCKESALTSCVYPAEMKSWVHAKPPLVLK